MADPVTPERKMEMIAELRKLAGDDPARHRMVNELQKNAGLWPTTPPEDKPYSAYELPEVEAEGRAKAAAANDSFGKRLNRSPV